MTVKELKQIHDMAVLFVLDASSLSEEKKRRTIASLMFLTKK